jgi:murein DD-endopeptidase MepM/ murein hydrolase activator NlpD
MAAIFDKQNVAKRQKISSYSSINKSAGFNSGFMSQFKQTPAHHRKNRKNVVSSFLSLIKRKKTETKHRWTPIHKEKPRFVRREKSKLSHKNTDAKKSSGFSFYIPVLPTLAVISGTVVIALAALNWEEISLKIPENFIYQVGADIEAEHQTLMYAATGITGISTNHLPVTETETEIMSDTEDHSMPELIAFEWLQYKVKRGDSVSTIAQKHGVSVGAIIASNEIKNARALQEGASLRIPNIDGIPYQVKNGDSLTKISASFSVPLEVILDVNDIKSDVLRTGETLFIPGARMNDMDLRLSLGELFIYPVQNRFITSHYGMRKDPISGAINFHTGIDFRANTGATVMAALDGVVSLVTENWLYGKYIIITHDNGYKTLYGHLSSFSVKQGDRVARGKKIGEAGNTGYSTGPHLHFTIYNKNNKTINPLDLLR